jgi:hypothetical protein
MPTMNSVRRWVENRDWNRTSWIVAIEVALIMVIASFVLPGGQDLYCFYLPFSKGCLRCGFVPYFAQWVLWPLAYIPTRFAWPVWTSISLAGWLGLCRYTKANPAVALLAFPAFGQMWLGQIDVLVCAGLALALLGKNAYVRGVGIAMALIKPQFSIISIVFLLSREREKAKVLAAPIAVAATSLVVFGINWPFEWIANSANHVPTHVWRLASMDFWVVGLLLLWLPLLFNERRARFEAAVLLSAISTPFVGVYSYIIFLVFVRKAWWSIPLSYGWLLAYPFWRAGAMRLVWILPLTLLLNMVYARFIGRPAKHST